MSDADLIKLFASTRDEAAFAALIDRHGPMVLGICRRILRNSADADDAFQATFILLAMRAGKIRQPHLLGNWLFGVATRTALNARRANQRRVVQEKRLMRILRKKHRDAAADADLHLTLDEEINRLPDKYRRVIVSCYLQGMTKREAAKHLKWPEGTVATRLSQAKELLRKRLSGQSSRASLDVLTAGLVPVAVPVTLSASTVKAAALAAAGKLAAAGAISAKAVTMAKGASKAMVIAKIKLAAALLLASSIAVTGTALATQSRSSIHTVAAMAPAQLQSTPPPVTRPTQTRPAQAPPDSISARRIRIICNAIILYSNAHAGHLPPDLGATLGFTGGYGKSPKDRGRFYLSPEDESKIEIPAIPTPQWVNEHTSFVYLGNSEVLLRKLRPAGILIVHEKLDAHHGDPIAVVFLDGGSTLLAPVQARWRIEGTKRAIEAAKTAAK